MSDLSFSDLDDFPFEDLFDDNPFLDETHRHLTVDGIKVHFKTGLTTETRKLLLTTCSNLNFGRFSPTRGLVMENKFLSDENSTILYRRMGFDFMAKYLLFQHLVETTSFGIDAWRVVLQCFGKKPGIVIDPVSKSNPSRMRQFQGLEGDKLVRCKYGLKSSKEVGDMFHGSLKINLLTVGPDRGPLLCDAQYPGHDLVQKARLKCCMELNDDARVDFCKQQLFPADNIFEVVDCLNALITVIEFEDLVVEEPPKKKVKLEIMVSEISHAAPEVKPPKSCRCRAGVFQKKEVRKEYEEIITKRKEPVKFQHRVWLTTCLVGGVFDYASFRLDFVCTLHDDTVLGMTVLLSLVAALWVSTHYPRSRMDWILYPVVLMSLTYFGLDYVVTRWIWIILHCSTVYLLNYSWKIAWIPLAVALVANWFTNWLPWIIFIKIPFVFLSYWNQHRRKQKNPASILLSPYRDWLILLVVLVTGGACCPN